MSDVSQGEGWWKASDGKWYSPDRRPAPQEGWWKASDGRWYPPERRPASQAPVASADADVYRDPGVQALQPNDPGSPTKPAKPWWRNPKVNVPLGAAAVVIVVVAAFVATTNHSNAYPASVRSEFLKGCDTSDGGGPAQAAACNCFLNWMQANRSEAQMAKADESTIAADVAAAHSSCPDLVYSNSGTGNSGTSGSSGSGGSSTSGNSGSGGSSSSGNSGSGSSTTSGNSGSAGSTSGNSGSNSSGTSGNTGTSGNS